jgi:hypothetical protein
MSDQALLESAAQAALKLGQDHPNEFDELMRGAGWTHALMIVRTLARGNHDVLLALIAANVTAGRGVVAAQHAEDWVRIAYDTTEQGYRRAAVAVGRYAQTLCAKAAAYQHDCPRCIYLETTPSATQQSARLDLYACPKHGAAADFLAVVRFGDNVEDCVANDQPDAARELYFARAKELAAARQLQKWY